MRRRGLLLAWLLATILTTQANMCTEDVDCDAVGARLQAEINAMNETCESALPENESICSAATSAWQDTQVTWNDYCGGSRIIFRKVW